MEISIKTRFNIGDTTVTTDGWSVKVIDIEFNPSQECVKYLLEYNDRSRSWHYTYEIAKI